MPFVRSLTPFSRMESVKLLQYFFSCLDVKRYYDLCRWKFLSSCVVHVHIFVFCLVSRIPSISTLSTCKTVMTTIHWLQVVRLPLQFTATLLLRCFDDLISFWCFLWVTFFFSLSLSMCLCLCLVFFSLSALVANKAL